ncbi:MAG: hypothetical protein K8S24_05245 [Candidatus Aegiribacteria sp.]|nr:hypothetical protein [Candidatus Aegiribacteria sp.]
MKKFAITSGALLIAFMFACGGDTTGPDPGPDEDWMPLTVGNWWNYVYGGFTFFGASADSFVVSGSTERRVTALLQHQGGFQVYEFSIQSQMILTDPDTTMVYADTQFVYIRNTGDEIRAYQDTVSIDYNLVALLPLTLGESWLTQPGDTHENEVTSLNASVTVPEGSFSGCAVITQTDTQEPTYQMDSYFHDGTGVVWDFVKLGDLQQITVSLETYYVQ